MQTCVSAKKKLQFAIPGDNITIDYRAQGREEPETEFLTRNRNRIRQHHTQGCWYAELQKWMKPEAQERKQKASAQAVKGKQESLQPKYPVQVGTLHSPKWIQKLAQKLSSPEIQL